MDQQELEILEGIRKSLNEIAFFMKAVTGILFVVALVYIFTAAI